MNAPFTPLERTVERVAREAASGVERADVRAVNTPKERAQYQARVQIYPKLVQGTFRNLKWALMAVMLAIYYGVPWIRWDRGANAPDQAVLVDVANGRFYFFWFEFWPQEVIFITGLLILSALGLFLATALFGRVWCGYACPQTIWTDLFILVERAFEGDRSARIRLDKSPWSLGKAWRKGGKHVVWLLIAAATGGAWIFYFHDAPTLLGQLFVGEAPMVAYAFLGLLTFTTYTLAGTMREQVCTYMCPWPRIQGALIDEETLSVTYRTDRGEPRSAHKKGQSWEGRGHCIDCNQCVAACPMGIDIRDGLQLECINCGLCIDACDAVMKKVGLPAGLIAFDNDLNITRRSKSEKARWAFVRSRTVLYTVVLALVGALMLVGLSVRTDLDVSIMRDRNPNFVTLADGRVRNGYSLNLVNRSPYARSFTVSVEGAAGLTVRLQGGGEGQPVVRVEADRVRAVRLYVTADPKALQAGQQGVTFVLEDTANGAARRVAAAFASAKGAQ